MPGAIQCIGASMQTCTPEGTPGPLEHCETLCAADIGCADCAPGATRCVGLSVERCEDGSNWSVKEECNALQGITCDATAGVCVGACLAETLRAQDFSHVGCEFYAVSSGTNTPSGDVVLGVFVVNPNKESVSVHAERPYWPGITIEVAPESTMSITLPWDKALTSPGGETKISPEGSIRIQSNLPVLVSQYNSLVPASNNDASLLLPVSSWGMRYAIVDYGDSELPSKPGFYNEGAYVVVAATNDTEVDLLAPLGQKVYPTLGIGTDGNGHVTLQAGEALQVLANGASDLTGSFVIADKPVQVLATHRCAAVPASLQSCDKLEEAMPPISALGLTHVVVPPVLNDNVTIRRAQVVRILAAEPGTSLSFEPAVALPATLANPGDFIEIGPLDQAFTIKSTHPVLVAQYMVGSGLDGAMTDPSLTVTLPVERYRVDYWVHSVPGWAATDLDVIAVSGTTVFLDGSPVELLAPIAGSNFMVGHVRLPEDPMAITHIISGDQPIGVSIYSVQIGAGDNKTTSYWRPAGYAFSH